MRYSRFFIVVFLCMGLLAVGPKGTIFYAAITQKAAIDFTFERYETKKISEIVGYFSEFNANYGIGVTKDRSSVFVYHRQTEEFRIFEVQGEGPGKTEEVFQVALLGNNRFCVFDRFRAHVFDLDRGKFIFECGPLIDQINYDSYSLPVVITENDVILPVFDPYREITSAAYFSDPDNYFYARLDLTTCQLRKGGVLARDNAYRKAFYAVRLRPIISPLDSRSFLSIFPFNTAVDIVDVSDFSIKKTIDLHPEHFGPLSSATGSGVEDQVAVMQANSAYRYVLASADRHYLLTQYKKGASEILAPEQYLSGTVTKLPGDKYYELYEIESGKKIGRDSKDTLGFIPLSFVSMDSVIFYSTSYQDEEGLFLHYAKIRTE